MKTENALLTEIIEECFILSADNWISQDQRREFLTFGKRLRGTLVNLLTAQFEEGTAQVVEANAQIRKINQTLKEEAERLANIANTVEQLGQLVSIVDDLVGIATGFV